MQTTGRSRTIACAVLLAVGGLAVASCGSRTGLFGTEDPSFGALDGSSPSADGRPPPFTDARDDGPVKCTPGRFTFDHALAQLMFVIDRSGSMAFALDGTQPNAQGQLPPGVLSRWKVLRNGLAKAIVPFDSSIAMGAKFYPEEEPPSPDADGCLTDLGVGISPAPGNATQILDVFDTTDPLGGTPTSEAVRIAAQQLSTSRAVARTMVLATDGAPNCNTELDQQTCDCTVVIDGMNICPNAPDGTQCLDDKRTINVIKGIFEQQKIPVYVIGIGGNEKASYIATLDQMAVSGGRAKPTSPRYYSATTETELNDALSSISGSVASCTYLTPSAPTDPSAVTVEIDGKTIKRDPTHTNGWDWVDQAYGTLAFFGPACAAASTGSAKVGGVVRCD